MQPTVAAMLAEALKAIDEQKSSQSGLALFLAICFWNPSPAESCADLSGPIGIYRRISDGRSDD
jgi:hypothetical protein